jgi:hypothetical protein
MKNQFNKNRQLILAKFVLLGIILCASNMLMTSPLFAQDGNAGIAEATNKVKGYFDTGCDLMYAIGAVVGIIGAIKVLCAMN